MFVNIPLGHQTWTRRTNEVFGLSVRSISPCSPRWHYCAHKSSYQTPRLTLNHERPEARDQGKTGWNFFANPPNRVILCLRLVLFSVEAFPIQSWNLRNHRPYNRCVRFLCTRLGFQWSTCRFHPRPEAIGPIFRARASPGKVNFLLLYAFVDELTWQNNIIPSQRSP